MILKADLSGSIVLNSGMSLIYCLLSAVCKSTETVVGEPKCTLDRVLSIFFKKRLAMTESAVW